MIGIFAVERPFPLCSIADRDAHLPNPATHRPVATNRFRQSAAADPTAAPNPLRLPALRHGISIRADSA